MTKYSYLNRPKLLYNDKFEFYHLISQSMNYSQESKRFIDKLYDINLNKI